MAYIKFEDVSSMVSGTVTGVVVLASHNVSTGKGGDYSQGKLKLVGGAFDYKAWGGAVHDLLVSENFQGKPVKITAEINIWNGSKSLIIKALELVEGDIDLSEFETSNYDIPEVEKLYWGTIKKNVSPEAQALFKKIYAGDVRKRFREEYAASTIHDATKGGLIAHTTKMLSMLDLIIQTYGGIREELNHDLLFIGLALHDVGKIYEYSMGSRTEYAYATHNFLGQELLFSFKEDIVETFGLDFYYRLQSVLQQHHGEFGEPCHTVEAYLIHLVDMFESRLTMLDESLPFSNELRVEFGKYRVS